MFESIKNNLTILGLFVAFLTFGCKPNSEISTRVVIDKGPGSPVVYVDKPENRIVLENHVIEAEWRLEDSSLYLKEVRNLYDQTSVNLDKTMLYAIESSGGKKWTSHHFKKQGELEIIRLKPTDSLPTKALKFAGKRITGNFLSVDNEIAIKWSAHLREGDNYIRQQIEIKSVSKPIEINRVTFFDGELKGAVYEGSVLGSPITYKNFFFGLEHPIAHSEALFSRTVGSITNKNLDVSGIIKEAGHYIAAVEHGGGPDDFNLNAISLLKDGEVISEDEHVLNGHNGSNLYHLKLKEYDSKSRYLLRIDLVNRDKASGLLHLYKKTNDVLNFYVDRSDTLQPGKTISEWAVIGVSPQGQKRRSFANYLERERARPYKQFLHYNCWWDITDDGASSFTSEQLIERMHAWNKKFIDPFGVKLDAFVFDDGWDDMDHVWYFDPVKFPKGFSKEAELCKTYKSGIGVWMSPFGGYLEAKRKRLDAAKREGLEINGRGLSLAGPRYYQRFYERAADMLINYKVNYFKFDGFGGSEPAYLPDMEAGARLIKNLRKLNPDVYVNITVGSWPSPFWLKYADCTWRGSGDLHNAGQGNTSQKFMTYRDGTLYNNIISRAPYYPLNSIMVVGIAYANLGHPSRYITDSKDDFKDMIRSFFGMGSSLQELYISHDKMKSDFWPILAEAAKWAKANEAILEDTHWIGGSPINLEVYGFASWKPGKGIITLRNPGNEISEFDLNLAHVFELLNNHAGTFRLKSPWKEHEDMSEMVVDSDQSEKITLQPFEVKVLEAYRVIE